MRSNPRFEPIRPTRLITRIIRLTWFSSPVGFMAPSILFYSLPNDSPWTWVRIAGAVFGIILSVSLILVLTVQYKRLLRQRRFLERDLRCNIGRPAHIEKTNKIWRRFAIPLWIVTLLTLHYFTLEGAVGSVSIPRSFSGFPLAITSMVVLPALITLAVFRRNRTIYQKAREHGFAICPECGYSLKSNPRRGQCPECGTPYDRYCVKLRWLTSYRWRRLGG